MECSFDERKRELEEECELPEGDLASACGRVQAFMEPFVDTYRRVEQSAHAIDVVGGLCSDL